jgi:hypothetical protein
LGVEPHRQPVTRSLLSLAAATRLRSNDLRQGETVTMHFVSKKIGGYRIYAVTGINTVSFAIDFREADTTDLLGFAVERHDPTEDERYFMYGMKIFRSIIPNPDEQMIVSTYQHPVQSFVWDDFTAKPDRR